MKRFALLLPLAALASCGKPAGDQPAQSESGSAADAVAAAPADPAAQPAAPSGSAATPVATASSPQPPSTSRDPAKVLLAWAKAMSLKDWPSAYLYWGDRGARSGLTLEQFSAKWGKLGNPEFELTPGSSEGAAGSLYYTAPIVLIDGKRRSKGEIVLRRVNDVDGATPEQLRWHIESLTVSP